jgi:hypothetical protein
MNKPDLKERPQAEKFRDAARQLGADESEETFDAALKKGREGHAK